MMGALLEEVYGQDFATSPSAPKKCDTVDELPKLRNEPETFVNIQQEKLPIIQNKDGFPFYIALLVTGVCSIYALDLFTSSISRK